jgi:nitroreductase
MSAPFREALLADGVGPVAAENQVARSQTRIESAPGAILLCLDERGLDRYSDPNRDYGERIMGVQGVALAGGSLLLAAHAEGLGAVWVCAPLFVPDVVQTSLGLPEEWAPQGLVLLGYPESIPEPKPRRSVEDVTWFL